mgnify:CR=1 FL=1
MIVSGGAGGDTSGGNKDNETASMKTKLLSGDHSDVVVAQPLFLTLCKCVYLLL